MDTKKVFLDTNIIITIQEHYEKITKGRVWAGKRETPQGERTPQGRELAAKKSESLSRGKRVPKQKDWARAIDELRREEHVDLNLTCFKGHRDRYVDSLIHQ